VDGGEDRSHEQRHEDGTTIYYTVDAQGEEVTPYKLLIVPKVHCRYPTTIQKLRKEQLTENGWRAMRAL